MCVNLPQHAVMALFKEPLGLGLVLGTTRASKRFSLRYGLLARRTMALDWVTADVSACVVDVQNDSVDGGAMPEPPTGWP